MSILDKIVKAKKEQVERDQSLYPIKLLEQSIYFDSPCVSMKEYVCRDDKSGIIAEFKRKSPSKGPINLYASPEKVSISYMQAGASAISVLTDKEFFGGSNEDLKTIRNYNYCPILRKEFIVSDYQIIEAKSIGADAILLIASILSENEIKQYVALAKTLGLEILFEVHDADEIKKYVEGIELIGVNNRNLKTFQTDYNYSKEIYDQLPLDAVKISESGINDANVVKELQDCGYDGFLIGEYFMASGDPGASCRKFVKELRSTRYSDVESYKS
ncbi:indole-3-glycerol phosphate synthase TrpC [Portibacter marinus]|uniref:indole-3-glycerol phosphate synthase TrpC n=1 Tax=Portibacter marinus TaxID=2898660 RepID=UPI001F35F0F6|nr:indole-3-glycerol phosphate synthase TrpC [Portibacter marinus]